MWGQMVTSSRQEQPLPPDTEARLASFTELVATAIANAEARMEVRRLVDEQAALRRVATLIAEGAAPTAVFDAVAVEMEQLLDAHEVVLSRYEAGAEVTVVAHRGAGARRLSPGTRLRHEGENVAAVVRRSERPARMAFSEAAQGAIADLARALSVDLSVGAPVVAEGRLWGVIQAGWGGEESPPADSEERMARFAGLLETAIANADSRDRLTASRARLLTEGDEARRRVVRDLHDGAQQRLVHTIVTLKLANRALQEQQAERVEALVGEALEHAQQGNTELRELATASSPPPSPTAVCGLVSTRSRRASTYRFKSMFRRSGSRRRSNAARTSSWRSRSRTSSSMRTPDIPKSGRSWMTACSTSRFATTESVVSTRTVTG